MRPLSKDEQTKKGCIYCADGKNVKVPDWGKRGKTIRHCIHDVCPYHEEKTEETVTFLQRL